MSDKPSYATGPTTTPVRDITLGDLLREAAESVPDRIAIVAATRDPGDRHQLTYAETYHQALRAARALRARFEPGERVAIWSPNSAEWVVAEFGAALAGVVLVTVNPSYQASELEYVLTQSKSAGILVWPEFRGNPMLATVEAVRERCTTLREVIRLDQWEAFLAGGDTAEVELPDIAPDDPVMIQYTSGTTGFPKGALLHHRGLVNNGADTMDRMGVDEGAVWITMMPLFHTGGCVVCVLGAVAKKATQVVLEMFEPGLVLEMMETHRAQALLGVPTMLIAMLEHPTFPSRDLSSLGYVCSGGSTVPAALVRRFEEELGARFTIVFGQTECSPVAAMTRPDDSVEDKATTLGPPMPNTETKIIDPDSGEIVPCGVVGEYCTRGYHVMHGYFDMPEATAATVDADGWLHTGDLCAMDERGFSTVQGRLKDMIIRGGENVYPREIEELLYQHEAIGDAAVVGLPDDKYGEVVGAVVRAAPGASLDREALFTYLRRHLSPQKTPTLWYSVEEFPLTGSGKIQKFRLRELWQAGALDELS